MNDEPGKVLIVDDDELNVMILSKIMSDHYACDEARSGEECLRKCEIFNPDLVLLDIMMPGIDGYYTCKRIKEQYGQASPQVMLVSAKASPQERLRGFDAGADDYVIKPFNQDELLARVNVQFRLRGALSQLAEAHSMLKGDNAELEHLVAERTAEAVEIRDITVFALARLAESRDPETGEHLERMREFSMILADQLAQSGGPYAEQITPDFKQALYRSSPLHDIGKVGLPDSILLKPGRLSPEEFEIMQHHTLIGAETLQEPAMLSRGGSFLKMAVEIARSHHERFDGTGYPDGLSGLDIPLSARIVAVADVFDALISARAYKKAFSYQIAHSMIVRDKGTHFDPVIVDAFEMRYEDLCEKAREMTPGSPKAENMIHTDATSAPTNAQDPGKSTTADQDNESTPLVEAGR